MSEEIATADNGTSLLLGDCLDRMRELPDSSIDSIVTDPPYGLSFMGKDWDYGVPGEAFWKEVLRVAKPGAHLLAFGGTRTYHRLACAIEDAGWEIKECLGWMYGSGFPKSMDVSKAIDKMLGAERTEIVGIKPGHENFIDRKNHPLNGGWDRPWAHDEDAVKRYHSQLAPATPEAKQWDGWGTQLKPAYEPIVMARKPVEGTIAANVLKYGTGAINIDGCRVPTEDTWTHGATKAKPAAEYEGGWKRVEQHGNSLGRFPANLIHDGSDEVLVLFPDSKGQCGAVKGTEPSRTGTNGIYGNYNGRNTMLSSRDSGSAARFFYCAKASRKERGDFNDHCTVKPLALMRYLVRLVTRKGGIVLDPFMGSGTTGIAAIKEGMKFVGIEKEPNYYEISRRRIFNSYDDEQKGIEQEAASESESTLRPNHHENIVQSLVQEELF